MSIIKNYFSQILSDADGNYSSKRSVTFLATFLVALGFIANLFWDYTVDPFMYESVMYIVVAGLGFTGAERFAPKKTGDS